MLVGLLREIDGVAAQVLMNQGLQLQPLGDEIARVRTSQSEIDSRGREFWSRIKSLWSACSFQAIPCCWPSATGSLDATLSRCLC